ncbi:ATP-binding protein [Micrococcus luteus]|uniref:ATP-binding protein n=1 Tax=Micrococcus luteus TaxID=1270 RepID=UPI00381AA6B8
MATQETADSALVEPNKTLFIDMLTRDVELVPAILDLWDNSVDGALRYAKIDEDGTFIENSLKGFRILIQVDSVHFSIEDNCGGIALATARDYAFRLGRAGDAPTVDGAVGSFGVGMKRSLFKMGNNFQVSSASQAGSFTLNVDVNEWSEIEEDVWRFPFEESNPDFKASDPKETFTRIRVWNPSEAVSSQFADDAFIARLKHELEIRRPEAFDLGIETKLNGTPLAVKHAMLKSSSDFRPLVKRFKTPEDVRVEIYAGLVAGARDIEANPDDDGDANKFVGHDEAGWYVLANGRVLLAADRTRLTGWGDNTARYHPQFRNFRGYVDIRANDSSNLPWNTSKTGVDESSPVWKLVYGAMRVALAEVQALSTRLKEDRREYLDSGTASPLLSAYKSASNRPIGTISPKQDSSLAYPKTESLQRTTVSIRYSVDKSRFEIASKELGMDSPSEVGRALFEYFWRIEIGD